MEEPIDKALAILENAEDGDYIKSLKAFAAWVKTVL